MTLEQISTINNAMSSLPILDDVIKEAPSVQACYQYILDHAKAMREANVPKDIWEHYQIIGLRILDERFL